MHFRFDLTRTIQAAAILLRKHPARRMEYIRLLKLLYISDREMLAQHGYTITGDEAVAMKKGPVLSRTYDLLKGEGHGATVWGNFIQTEGYQAVLRRKTGRGKLSAAALAKLKEVSDRYRNMATDDLIDETHKLREWKKVFPPGSRSSHPIPWELVLKAQGKAELIPEVEKDERASALFDRIFDR
jgi:uncharacterized phage-associated protein